MSDALLNVRCPRCGARPGEPCRTRTGHAAAYPHISRQDALRETQGSSPRARGRDRMVRRGGGMGR